MYVCTLFNFDGCKHREPERCISYIVKEKGSDEVAKTEYVKLWDWLARSERKDEKVSLATISLLVQIGEQIW